MGWKYLNASLQKNIFFRTPTHSILLFLVFSFFFWNLSLTKGCHCGAGQHSLIARGTKSKVGAKIQGILYIFQLFPSSRWKFVTRYLACWTKVYTFQDMDQVVNAGQGQETQYILLCPQGS